MIICVVCEAEVGSDNIDTIDDFLYVKCPKCGATNEYYLRKTHLNEQ